MWDCVTKAYLYDISIPWTNCAHEHKVHPFLAPIFCQCCLQMFRTCSISQFRSTVVTLSPLRHRTTYFSGSTPISARLRYPSVITLHQVTALRTLWHHPCGGKTSKHKIINWRTCVLWYRSGNQLKQTKFRIKISLMLCILHTVLQISQSKSIILKLFSNWPILLVDNKHKTKFLS